MTGMSMSAATIWTRFLKIVKKISGCPMSGQSSSLFGTALAWIEDKEVVIKV
jgi:hypothetical protein